MIVIIYDDDCYDYNDDFNDDLGFNDDQLNNHNYRKQFYQN